ncbi:hypothetical protein [Paenibacillus chitinolyticus]
MLSDQERKILRILFNFSRNCGRMPDPRELETKSGFSMKDIKKALAGLKEQGYILGGRLSEVRIIEAWEREEHKPKTNESKYRGPWLL